MLIFSHLVSPPWPLQSEQLELLALPSQSFCAAVLLGHLLRTSKPAVKCQQQTAALWQQSCQFGTKFCLSFFLIPLPYTFKKELALQLEHLPEFTSRKLSTSTARPLPHTASQDCPSLPLLTALIPCPQFLTFNHNKFLNRNCLEKNSHHFPTSVCLPQTLPTMFSHRRLPKSWNSFHSITGLCRSTQGKDMVKPANETVVYPSSTPPGFNQNTLWYQGKYFREMKLPLYPHSCFHQPIYNPVKER